MRGKGIKVTSKKFEKGESQEFLDICKEEDILIMGNLSNSYMFEKDNQKIGSKNNGRCRNYIVHCLIKKYGIGKI